MTSEYDPSGRLFALVRVEPSKLLCAPAVESAPAPLLDGSALLPVDARGGDAMGAMGAPRSSLRPGAAGSASRLGLEDGATSKATLTPRKPRRGSAAEHTSPAERRRAAGAAEGGGGDMSRLEIRAAQRGDVDDASWPERWHATPLFLALCVIGVSDLVFAIDSIPAILSVTTDTFIVVTSNCFAVLGLHPSRRHDGRHLSMPSATACHARNGTRRRTRVRGRPPDHCVA